MKVAATLVFVLAVVATPRERVLGLRRSTPCCWPRWPGWPACRWPLLARRLRRRGAVRRVRPVPPDRRRGPAHRGAGPVAVGAGPVGRLEHPGQGHPRRRGHHAARHHDVGPELLRGLDRLRVPRAFTAIAGFMVRYVEVITGEVRPHAHRPPVAGLRPPLAVAGPGRGRRRRARCSSGPSSGASACTWPWCPGASPASCPRRPGTRTRRASGPLASLVPAAGGRGRRDRAGWRHERRRRVHVDGLAYAYPDGRQALRGVDLDVAAGERVAVLGPNGAGKTTLVLHLNGILLTAGRRRSPSAGSR